ncbi:DUF4214 domain-containing protein [Herbaspirillum sp. HC18]|nr:DUF4214 domain-containing protein [Herbaspirillum sp. HC18]
MAITTQMRTDVANLYVALFGRAPERDGLGYWVQQLDAGKTVAQIAQDMYNTEPARANYPTFLTNSEIIGRFYTNVLGRTADADGLAYWTAKLNAGQTKGSVINEMITAVTSFNGTGTDDLSVAARTSKDLFNNKVAVGLYYAVDLGGNDVTKAATILAGVTSAASSVDAAKSTASTVEGGTFTLTGNPDTISPTSATAATKSTAGNDTFRAPADGNLGTADFIDGGDGTDTLTATVTAADQTIAPTLKSVEAVTLTVAAADTMTFTFDASSVTGANTVTIKDAGAVSMNTSDELITVSKLAKTTTLGIEGGTAATGATASEITATFAGAVAADTQKVAISNAGKVGVLTLSTAETVEITATGTGTTGANTIGSLAASAVKTLNLKGAGDLTISASDLASTVTVDATAATGKIAFTGENNAAVTFKGGSGNTTVTLTGTANNTVTTGAGNDTISVDVTGNQVVDAGAGNDRVLVGASSNITADDSVKGGDGTDTVVVTDATINATVKTNLAKGVSGFERLETTATGTVVIDYSALSAYDAVTVSGASGAPVAVNDTTGAASITATMENADSLTVSAARVGQAGGNATVGNNGFNGGAGIAIAPKLDAGSNAATLSFVGNADITGGAGGAAKGGSGGNGGNGGDGINASTIESLSITVVGTQPSTGAADTVTVRGGALGAKDGAGADGAAGNDVVVGTNATITISSDLLDSTAAKQNNLDLGTVKGTNVTINASAFKGALTVTAGDGNVTITGGSGADVLTGGAGVDTINGGAGNDTIDGKAGANVLTGGGGRDAFKIATQTNTTFEKVTDFGKATAAATVTEVQAMSSIANFQATATAKGGAEADLLDLAPATTTLTAYATWDAASDSGNAGKAINAAISSKGVLTLTGADAGLVDTVAEFVALLQPKLGANEMAVFELNGDTYVFHETDNAGNNDTVVQLVGVTGVTGLVVAGGAVAAAAGDVFII